MIVVANASRDFALVKTGEYIGRGDFGVPISPLANPFKIPRHGDREAVVALYRAWLHAQIRAGEPPVLNALARLAGIHERTGRLTLVCWCSPKLCHGDVVKSTIEEVMRNEFD